LPGQRNAEGDAIVVGAGHHGEGATAVAQRQGEFVEVIAHLTVLAEVVLPVMVDRSARYALNHWLCAEAHITSQFQTEARAQQQRLSVHSDAVSQRCIGVERENDGAVGRMNARRRGSRGH
jgi:hypothetical protein